MYRKTALLLAALAVMLVAPQAHAAKGAWVIDFNAGAAIPMSEYKDVATTGFMGGVGFGYGMSDAVIVGVDGMFAMNDGSDELNAALTDIATTIEGTPTTVEGKFNILQGGAHLKYMFGMGGESRVSPYGLLGLGIYNFKAKTESDNPTYEGEDSVSKFGGRGALGFEYKATQNVGIGLEGSFHLISTEGESTKFVGVQAIVTVGMSPGE